MSDRINRQENVGYIKQNSLVYATTLETWPAADVREVVHGEWEIVTGSNGKEYMVCTNCRVQQDLTGVFSFCPNCGAEMRGGNDD